MKVKSALITIVVFIIAACNSQPPVQPAGSDVPAEKPAAGEPEVALVGPENNAELVTSWRNGTGGVYPDTDLLDKWPDGGPEIIWSYGDLGQGHSSPVIAGNYLYVTGMKDGNGYMFKFDLKGNLVYSKPYGSEFTESYVGPRGTPVIAGDRIYLISGKGQLYCLKEADAETVWMVDMVKDLNGKVITWGYNETPVIYGNVIYCTPGGRNSVVALDRQTGKLIWSCPGKNELSAYCTPLLFEHNGRLLLATHTASSLLGIDAKTGDLLWTQHHPNQWSVHANTPIYHKGELFYFSGYGQGSGKLSLSQDGASVTKEWRSIMDNRIGGAVRIGDYIYGSGDNSREWRCIDWETGKDLYLSDAIAKGVVIAADGKLICYSERGELALVNATPEKFEVMSLARVTMGSEQHWAHPVINDGILFLRHGNALIAYNLK